MSKTVRADELLGCLKNDINIYVNLNLLWHISSDLNGFINNFVKIYVHEVVHQEIRECFDSLFESKEEDFVDIMSGTKTLELNKYGRRKFRR